MRLHLLRDAHFAGPRARLAGAAGHVAAWGPPGRTGAGATARAALAKHPRRGSWTSTRELLERCRTFQMSPRLPPRVRRSRAIGCASSAINQGAPGRVCYGMRPWLIGHTVPVLGFGAIHLCHFRYRRLQVLVRRLLHWSGGSFEERPPPFAQIIDASATNPQLKNPIIPVRP